MKRIQRELEECQNYAFQLSASLQHIIKRIERFDNINTNPLSEGNELLIKVVHKIQQQIPLIAIAQKEQEVKEEQEEKRKKEEKEKKGRK